MKPVVSPYPLCAMSALRVLLPAARVSCMASSLLLLVACYEPPVTDNHSTEAEGGTLSVWLDEAWGEGTSLEF